MAVKLKRYKKYAPGGDLGEIGAQAGGPAAKTAQNNEATKGVTGVANNIPVWGQLVGATTQVSGAIRGDETNATNNAIANTFDPASTVLEFANKGDWGDAAISLINPIGGGILQSRAAKKEAAERAAKQYTAKTNYYTEVGRQRLAGEDLIGNMGQENIYAMGGNLAAYMKTRAVGGKLDPLNSDTVEVEGRTHEEGGVKLPQAGAEVEDGETIAGNYVFSDLLGFADRHKPIARQIGKIEKKPASREGTSTLAILRKKEQALANEQETVKSMLGLGDDGKMAMGGRLKKYATGSLMDNPDMFTLADRVPRTDYSLGAQAAGPAVKTATTDLNNTTNTQGNGSGWLSLATGLAPYVSNIANSFRKLPMPAQPVTEQGINPKLVSYGADKVALDKALRGINLGVEQGSNNVGLTRATKVANIGKFLDAKAQLTQQENNANAGITNRAREFNSGVNLRNVERQNGYNDALVNRLITQQNLRSENLADASNKFQLQQRDSDLKNLENRKLDILPGLYKDTGVLNRNYEQNLAAEKYRAFGGPVGKYDPGAMLRDPMYYDKAQDDPSRKVSYIWDADKLYIDDNGDLQKRTKKPGYFSPYQAQLAALKNLPKKRSGGLVLGNKVIPVQSVLKYLV